MTLFKQLIILFSIFLFSNNLQAKKIFVSKLTSELQNGTIQNPYGKISKAVEIAEAGDEILIDEGIYRNEKIKFKTSGTKGNEIVLRAKKNSRVEIHGAKQIHIWQNNFVKFFGRKVYSSKANKFFGQFDRKRIARFEKSVKFKQQVDARYKPQNMLIADGKILQEMHSIKKLIPDSYFCDKKNQLIYLWLSKGKSPNFSKILFTNQQTHFLNTNQQSHIKIEGLHFKYLANPAQIPYSGVFINGGENVTINNCSVSKVAGTGLGVIGNKHIISNSKFNWNGQQGVVTWKTNQCNIINSETSYNNRHIGKTYNPGWEAGGNKFTFSKNLKIIGLKAFANHGTGIWVDIDNHNVLIKNSIATHNWIGIHYEISYSGIIEGNISAFNEIQSYNPKLPLGTGIYIASSANCIIRNNICIGNKKHGIIIGGAIRRNDGNKFSIFSHSNIVTNNIVAHNQLSKNIKTHSFAIGLNHKTYKYELEKYYKKSKLRFKPFKNFSNFNVFYSNKSDCFFGTSNYPSFKTLEEWQLNSSHDKNSIMYDFPFRNWKKGDFRIKKNTKLPKIFKSKKRFLFKKIKLPKKSLQKVNWKKL